MLPMEVSLLMTSDGTRVYITSPIYNVALLCSMVRSQELRNCWELLLSRRRLSGGEVHSTLTRLHWIWSNLSDRKHDLGPQEVAKEGKSPAISGKSRLVKHWPCLARLDKTDCGWLKVLIPPKKCDLQWVPPRLLHVARADFTYIILWASNLCQFEGFGVQR